MRLNFIYSCVLNSVLISILSLNGNHAVRFKIIPPDKMQGKLYGKIVDGFPVDIKQFPSAVILFNSGALCSGTVLNSWVVMSAAHCFDHNIQTNYISIHVGSRYRIDQNAIVHSVASVKVHEDYNKAMPFACDIALVFVEKEFDFSGIVEKAIIVGDSSWMDERQQHFIVTGWGVLNYTGPLSEVGLLMTSMGFISRDKCGQLHGLTLTPDMFCLYGDGKRDTCKGDSGGGVLWNRMVVGIVSHGDGCALKNKPSVYSNVFYLRGWIKKTIKTYFDSNCRNRNRRKKMLKARTAENHTYV